MSKLVFFVSSFGCLKSFLEYLLGYLCSILLNEFAYIFGFLFAHESENVETINLVKI